LGSDGQQISAPTHIVNNLYFDMSIFGLPTFGRSIAAITTGACSAAVLAKPSALTFSVRETDADETRDSP
jgi:hypothetical protein